MAARPDACRFLEDVLADVFELISVHTMEDALAALERESGIQLIVSTVGFDDSRMLVFLDAAKRHYAARKTPFLCCRVLPSILANESLDRLAAVCRHAGAADYVDVPTIESAQGRDAAVARLRDAARRCIGWSP